MKISLAYNWKGGKRTTEKRAMWLKFGLKYIGG